MSEASIPAWKRVGLKQSKQTPKQSQADYDPLKEGLKRAHESGDTAKADKPAKKPKLPKAERPAPTYELDQLAYLRQYSEDRENWKFSKQKQNWILKHAFTEITDDRYDQPLINYIVGLMGSAKNRIIEDAKGIVERWNNFMKEDLEKQDQQSQEENDGKSTESNSMPSDGANGGADSETTKDKTTSSKSDHSSVDNKASQPTDKEEPVDKTKNNKKSKAKAEPNKPTSKVPTEKMARRAQQVVKLLTEENLELEFLDNTS